MIPEYNDIKALEYCPNCGSKYVDEYSDKWNYDDFGIDTYFNVWNCPGCGCKLERVFNFSHVNVYVNE